jgi:hypothetical protein
MLPVVKVQETMKQGEHITLVPTGDWHLGAADTDEFKLRADIKAWAADSTVRLLLMGDLGDLIDGYGRDRRAHPHGLPERYQDAMFDPDGGIPSETVAHVTEILDPFIGKNRIWGIVAGNHERTIERNQSRSLVTEYARELNSVSKLLGVGGFVRVTFKEPGGKASSTRGSLVIHAHHGYQAGRTTGAKVNQLDKELGWSDADILVRGHSHDKFCIQVPSFQVKTQHVRSWNRIIAHTGTYKTGMLKKKPGEAPQDSWEETKLFRYKTPELLGPPVIEIRYGRINHRDNHSPSFDYRVIT